MKKWNSQVETICATMVIFLIPFYLFSQRVLIIDLSQYSPGSVISKQGNLSFDSIIIQNTVAKYTYIVDFKKSIIVEPPLNIDISGLTAVNEQNSAEECKQLLQKINNLMIFQAENEEENPSENSLSKIVKDLNKELQTHKCKEDSILKEAEYYLSTTRKKIIEQISIHTGEKLTITISRDTTKWTFIYEGEPQGQWVSSYGFGFTSKALGSRPYFAEQLTDTSTFKITQSKESYVLDLNYIPAVFFSYFLSQNFGKYWNKSFTGGLGFDLSAPVVFLGYNQMYKQNIGFSIGLAFQQQYVLKDQYSKDQSIGDFLDKDQLHDKVYRPNFFISANFRLGKNPFQEDEPKDNQEKK